VYNIRRKGLKGGNNVVICKKGRAKVHRVSKSWKYLLSRNMDREKGKNVAKKTVWPLCTEGRY